MLSSSIRYISPLTLKPPRRTASSPAAAAEPAAGYSDASPPPGALKSILPCTPLAIVRLASLPARSASPVLDIASKWLAERRC